MQIAKKIYPVAAIFILGFLLTGCSSANQSQPQAQSTQQTLPSSPEQPQRDKPPVSSETQTPAENDTLWLPNHRTQSIKQSNVNLVFVDKMHGWKMIPGQGVMMNEPVEIYKTTDGGESWQRVAIADQKNISAAESTNLPAGTLPYGGIKNGLSFVDSSQGWITGYIPRTGYQWIFVTNDGGHTWNHQELPVPKDISKYTSMTFDLIPPTFFNSQDGILIEKVAEVPKGKKHPTYVFFFTSDGGKSWVTQLPANLKLTFPNSDSKQSGQNFSIKINKATWNTKDGGYSWKS